MTPLTLVTVDFIMIVCRNAKPKEFMLISSEYNSKFQLHFKFGFSKMFVVMAFFNHFDHKKLYNSTFVLFFFQKAVNSMLWLERHFLTPSSLQQDRSVERFNFLSTSIEIILENSRSINFNQRAAYEKLGHFYILTEMDNFSASYLVSQLNVNVQ